MPQEIAQSHPEVKVSRRKTRRQARPSTEIAPCGRPSPGPLPRHLIVRFADGFELAARFASIEDRGFCGHCLVDHLVGQGLASKPDCPEGETLHSPYDFDTDGGRALVGILIAVGASRAGVRIAEWGAA